MGIISIFQKLLPFYKEIKVYLYPSMTAFTSLCALGEEGRTTKGRNGDKRKTQQTHTRKDHRFHRILAFLQCLHFCLGFIFLEQTCKLSF